MTERRVRRRSEGCVEERSRVPHGRLFGRTLLVFLYTWCVTGCGWLTAPLPPAAVLFAPPAIYARWWAMIEACSGRTGDFTAVHWYRVPGAYIPVKGVDASGYWSTPGNRIAMAATEVDHGSAVRHEMLHALLGKGGHPRAEFLGACASLVSCAGCIIDGGPWHAPRSDYVLVPPESLQVRSQSELLPREADGQRWLVLHISVYNPSARPVLVKGPRPVTPPTFGYDLEGPNGGIMGGEVSTDSSTLFFLPLETKQWLFDFRVASDLDGYHVPPATYHVRGGYAQSWARYETVTVAP